MFIEAFAAVICANFLTVWVAYFMWRIKKDEQDYRAMIGFLICLIPVVVVGYALKYPN